MQNEYNNFILWWNNIQSVNQQEPNNLLIINNQNKYDVIQTHHNAGPISDVDDDGRRGDGDGDGDDDELKHTFQLTKSKCHILLPLDVTAAADAAAVQFTSNADPIYLLFY